MKPAIRNGLTALILILLAVSVGTVVVRHRRSDRTSVSAAPVASTTTPPTTAPPTTETTVTTETTSTAASPTSSGPATSGPTTSAGANLASGASAATTVPDTTVPDSTVPDTTAGPGADGTTVQAGPAGLAEHPHTGRRSLLLPALVLIGVGLAGLRMTRRTPPTSTV